MAGLDYLNTPSYGTTGSQTALKQQQAQEAKARADAAYQQQLADAERMRQQQSQMFQNQQEMFYKQMHPELIQTNYGALTRPSYEQFVLQQAASDQAAKRALSALNQTHMTTTQRSSNIDPTALQALLALMPHRV